MTAWMRKSDAGSLNTLAYKARRRGDAKEAVLWCRALHLRQQADALTHDANQRRWAFYNTVQKMKDMEEELQRLRRYVACHPYAQAAKAADEAQASSP